MSGADTRGNHGAEWAEEGLYPGWGQRFRVVRQLVEHRSAFQDIRIFESATHGRVLMLDGVVQITEGDEFVYQEMLTHVPLIEHGAVRNVLIIGAGDGGVLRRALMHRSVERVVMVEIDGDVVRLAREFMPTISGTCWDDRRAELIIGDGIAFVADAPTDSYDVVIVDSTDPIGVGEVLFTDEFYRHCARVVGPRGIVVNQCGVPFMQSDELRETSARRRQHFGLVSAYVAAVPTYVGGFMTLGIAYADRRRAPLELDAIERRARDAGIVGTARYWSPEVHRASFALPPYIAECLPAN